ncbi:acid phosphatase type 7 isoform X1 [Neodiprion virginianus]|uniref:acid phosphatase type 7 isoform X1 n=2 Tax=Neodiprion fabricii TaxID=2872261 RepID=UPI001ED95781|nr:acid phosphatase type 7 isoform X1 [Neodiprion fabricii]XP_046624910.1 acid phosphatase type 7 isoform X1 [Neodiprion virginianus]
MLFQISTCTMIPTSLILVLGILGSALGIVQYQPEAVHIAYGDNVHDISITWTTMDKTQESIVQYGINGYALTAKGNSTPFVDGGRKKHKQYIHRVLLKDLTPGSKYVYQCGNEYAWSDMFYFVTAPTDQATWAPQVVIFGDMGNENAQSLRRLQEETQRGLYDAAIHVGDFAYDMNTNNAAVGDQFMRQIESIAAYLPYMTVPGNHEEKYNFSNYRARFTMPGESEGLWYSFNMGPVHFIGIETEAYYFMNYGLKQLVKQYEWLDNDLREANKPENRAKRPWIVTFGHRPMYCSNANADDCTNHQSLVRVGLPLFHWFGLEDLFYKHKVDLEIWAHEHSYERLWPMYNFKVYNGSYEQPYRNYKAPVHIVTGSAGCKEGKEKFIPNRPDWSAYRSSDYGYTRLKAFNTTHLYLEQVSDDKQGAVLDQLWLIKDDLWPEYTPN